MTTKSLDYLIPYVRLRVGDTNSAAYRYLDEWIMQALTLAVKNLQKFWNFKYITSDGGVVYRNPSITEFLFDESYGVIEDKDENVIVLMASIIMLEGSLENSAWDAVSWKDAEISFSNLEQFRSRDASLKRMIDELYSLIKPPTKRLAWVKGYPLQGFKDNPFENNKKY